MGALALRKPVKSLGGGRKKRLMDPTLKIHYNDPTSTILKRNGEVYINLISVS